VTCSLNESETRVDRVCGRTLTTTWSSSRNIPAADRVLSLLWEGILGWVHAGSLWGPLTGWGAQAGRGRWAGAAAQNLARWVITVPRGGRRAGRRFVCAEWLSAVSDSGGLNPAEFLSARMSYLQGNDRGTALPGPVTAGAAFVPGARYEFEVRGTGGEDKRQAVALCFAQKVVATGSPAWRLCTRQQLSAA
jgi:hypothetical protein